MEAAKRAQFFKKLEAEIQKSSIETKMVPPHGDMGEILRAVLPVTDEGDPNVLEIVVVPFVEEADLLVFNTTMLARIGSGCQDLLAALQQWNVESPLGAFGIYDNRRMGVKQLFHKYSLLFDPNVDPEELAQNAVFHILLLYEVVSRKYQEARRLSDGGAY